MSESLMFFVHSAEFSGLKLIQLIHVRNPRTSIPGPSGFSNAFSAAIRVLFAPRTVVHTAEILNCSLLGSIHQIQLPVQ